MSTLASDAQKVQDAEVVDEEVNEKKSSSVSPVPQSVVKKLRLIAGFSGCGRYLPWRYHKQPAKALSLYDT